MTSSQTFITEVCNDVVELRREYERVYSDVVRPLWNEYTRHFPATLYGYIMNVFAIIDLLSVCFDPTCDDQTKRMVEFMLKYIGRGSLECHVAVQMWRHTLMHTSKPRYLKDESDGITYKWLLHWSGELPQEQHFALVQLSNTEKKINLSLDGLIQDLESGMNNYFQAIKSDPDLMEKLDTGLMKIDQQVLRNRSWL